MLFLVVYLPLEEFILKWVPVSIAIFNYLLLISDFIILLIIIIYLSKSNFILKIRKENKYLFWFIIFSLVSLIYYQHWNAYFLKIWVLTRYIILFFIVRKTFTKNTFKKFEKYFILIFFIQVIVGVIQFFEFPILYELFTPRGDLPKAANWFVKGEMGLAGTFTFTVNYGYFMYAFSAFIVISEISNNKKLALIFITSILSLYSESTISFLVTFILFLRYYSLVYPKLFYRLILFIIVFLILFFKESLMSFFSPLILIFDMFSEQWIIESLMFTRLGILKLFPLFFSNDLFTILFGFSLDGETLTLFVQNIMGNDIPHVLLNNTVVGIEDVYWVAHLYYFGLIGVIFYLLIFKKIYNLLNPIKTNYKNKNELYTIRFFLILTLLTAFINQTFSFKSFIFYFFMIIAYAMFKIREEQINYNN